MPVASSRIGWPLWMLIFLCTIAASGLGLELYFTSQGKSLCPTSSCEVVAQYVRFGEPMLLAAGACFFLLLATAFFFANRYASGIIARFPLLILAGGVAFDGAIFGFQFITLGQRCLICITVACVLWVISLLYALSLRKAHLFFLCALIWVCGVLANGILIMPDVTKASSDMIFYTRAAGKEFAHAPTGTLIFSMECSHCQEVVEYLAETNPRDMSWRLAIIDSEKDSINKLGHFYAKAAQAANPFRLLMDAKEGESRLPFEVAAEFPQLTRQARVFLSNNGLLSIPVLVVDEEKGRKVILTGSDRIIDYLRDRHSTGLQEASELSLDNK